MCYKTAEVTIHNFHLIFSSQMQVAKQPNKPCILFGDESWTYLDIHKRSNKLTHSLRDAKLLQVGANSCQ